MRKHEKKKALTKVVATVMAASLILGSGGTQVFAKTNKLGKHDMGNGVVVYGSVSCASRMSKSATSTSVITGQGCAVTCVRVYWWLGNKHGSVVSSEKSINNYSGSKAISAKKQKPYGGAEITKAKGYHRFSGNGNYWGTKKNPKTTLVEFNEE